MSLTVTPIPLFSDNYAWLLRDASGATAVVDPADPGPVLAALDGRCDLILLTHHHADHVAGTDAVRAATGARVVGNVADAARLPRLDDAVAPGGTVTLGGSRATVIDTPGHTIGHVSFAFPDAVFCGDTLFSMGCGRLLEGTALQMFASLAALAALPEATLVFCGHEYTLANAKFARHVDPANQALRGRAEEAERQRAEGRPTVPTTIATERATNPFVRAPDAATLGALRLQKDGFR